MKNEENPVGFDQLGLSADILASVERMGWTHTTPIQAQSIPQVLEGKDLLGIAQTGTGKTAAFVLPMLNKLLELDVKAAPGKVGALVIVPTRELAKQVSDQCNALKTHAKFYTTMIVGGARFDAQERALRRGTHVLVATPGRLEDHLKRKNLSLEQTAIVVLDEADQMFDMGFAPAIKRILTVTPKRRQTLLFSATMPPAILGLAKQHMKDPVQVSVQRQGTPVEKISQRVFSLPQSRKQSGLVQILNQEGVERAIVFVRTKRGADRVQRVLDKVGIASQALHGDRSQGQRTRALQEFRDGRTKILVATDVAARGIDVPAISHVVNYDLPDMAETYVHRIGRTARAGLSGEAISLMNPTERSKLKEIEKLIKIRFTVEPLKVEDQTSQANQEAHDEQQEDSERDQDRLQKRRHAHSEASFADKQKRQGRKGGPGGKAGKSAMGQRARKRDRDADQDRPPRAFADAADVADANWERGFERDLESAEGRDSRPSRKPDQGRKKGATAKGGPRGKGGIKPKSGSQEQAWNPRSASSPTPSSVEPGSKPKSKSGPKGKPKASGKARDEDRAQASMGGSQVVPRASKKPKAGSATERPGPQGDKPRKSRAKPTGERPGSAGEKPKWAKAKPKPASKPNSKAKAKRAQSGGQEVRPKRKRS